MPMSYDLMRARRSSHVGLEPSRSSLVASGVSSDPLQATTASSYVAVSTRACILMKSKYLDPSLESKDGLPTAKRRSGIRGRESSPSAARRLC